ncbi:MAG: VanZ family protein [Dysgonamonadaceae bacterium]|jgi:VanZ family protein|nr:VanZ family protein [Dysgonamonadaceae bacterium]
MSILKKYRLSLVFIAVITALCFINPSEVPSKLRMTNFDKAAHFLMFLGLSGSIFFDTSYHLTQKVRGRLIFGGSFLFPVVFGGVIEIAQEYLTATRSGDWRDLLFDAGGILCGCLVCLQVNRKLGIK